MKSEQPFPTPNPQPPTPISAVIVAGGRSQRMGHDKRRIRLWGETGPMLLHHTLDLIRSFSDDPIVVLNDPHAWPDLPARIVSDVYPDGGSLGGIYSGLLAARYEHALVVAADMPLLNADLIRWMILQPRDYDVLVPRLADRTQARNRLGVESLHAIYSRACLDPIRQQLDAGNPQVIGFFGQVRVRLIEPATIAQFDLTGDAFRNVNTPEDLALVQQRIARSEVQ